MKAENVTPIKLPLIFYIYIPQCICIYIYILIPCMNKQTFSTLKKKWYKKFIDSFINTITSYFSYYNDHIIIQIVYIFDLKFFYTDIILDIYIYLSSLYIYKINKSAHTHTRWSRSVVLFFLFQFFIFLFPLSSQMIAFSRTPFNETPHFFFFFFHHISTPWYLLPAPHSRFTNVIV